MLDVFVLLVGVACAGAGGELFVRGVVNVASWARVPARVVGTTVAAFATSSPEMSVALQASRSGEPAVALGDALGSNVINLGLVLGITLVAGAQQVKRVEVRRELSVAALAPLLTIAVLVDGRMVRSEATLLLLVFLAWLALVTRSALRSRGASGPAELSTTPLRTVLAITGGLVLLVVAGGLIVVSTKDIGAALGLDPFVVGATLVALGTSAPELATTVIARARGHADVGLGTVLGSNVFNNLWIVGLASLVEPIEVGTPDVSVAIAAGLIGLIFVIPNRDGVLGRGRGIALLVVFVAYTAVTIAVGG